MDFNSFILSYSVILKCEEVYIFNYLVRCPHSLAFLWKKTDLFTECFSSLTKPHIGKPCWMVGDYKAENSGPGQLMQNINNNGREWGGIQIKEFCTQPPTLIANLNFL